MLGPEKTAVRLQKSGRSRNEDAFVTQAVRRRIVSVAKHKFAFFGYEGTAFADVARSADLEPDELLSYFDNKLDMLLAVFEDGWAEVNQRLGDILLASVDARQAALSMLALMMHIMERDEDLARLLIFEGRRPHPETGEIMLSEGYRAFERLCVQLAVRGQKDGSFSSEHSPVVIACMLTGAVENLVRSYIIGSEKNLTVPFTPSEILSAFDALVTALKPRHA